MHDFIPTCMCHATYWRVHVFKYMYNIVQAMDNLYNDTVACLLHGLTLFLLTL